MPDPKPNPKPNPIPEGAESVKSCSYAQTADRLKHLQSLKGHAGRGWRVHHKKSGTASILVKLGDEE
jgi:hypothetical protein